MDLRHRCRHCDALLETTMVDLGVSPLCESFLRADQIDSMEPFYPLHVRVCSECYLAQVGEYVSPAEIFDDYAYYSAYSTAWLEHSERYVEMMIERFGLTSASQITEIASNDGYLLQYFTQRGIQVLGIEPAANVAVDAEARGVPTRVEFFDLSLARELAADGYRTDVIIGNNVLAQVPDINDFVAGLPVILADDGVITFEFPHLVRLIEENQFDTIYHEHFSYFSLTTAATIFESVDLAVFDVEELWTHGGSLRLFLRHSNDESKPTQPSVKALLRREHEFGIDRLDTYTSFGSKVEATKRRLLRVLIDAKERGKSIAVYGAAGKGNTLLNYCGIGADFIDYACDRSPYKHGRYTPGMRIPIFPPEHIAETKPDYVLILPWNLKDEIMTQLDYIHDWGGRFIVPIPDVRVYPEQER